MPLKAKRIDSKLESLPEAKAGLIEPIVVVGPVLEAEAVVVHRGYWE